MKEYFADIEELKFTAGMEQKLDAVEEGSVAWKDVLRDFYYDGFEEHLKAAESGERKMVPPAVSDEICPVCGKNLVEKDGKFGPFLACPGYPECTFTMPLVEVMPGRCPKCGGRLMKRTGTSKQGKQYTYHCCEYSAVRAGEEKCEFMTWDVPVKDDCPACGQTMFKRAGKGFKKPFCINAACSNFLPEEKRGYPKSKTAETKNEAEEKAPAQKAVKKTTGKSGAAKKPAAAKSTKKPAVKKPAAKAVKKNVDAGE